MSVCDFKGEIVFRNKFEFKVYILANFAQCVGVPADTLKKNERFVFRARKLLSRES